MISSSQISAMTGQFQQQTLAQQQQASMLSARYFQDFNYMDQQLNLAPTMGEDIAARGINTTAAYATPIARFGGALMGADPLSGAIAGGFAGAALGPLGMIGGAVGGAALGAGAQMVGSTIGYGAGQMMTGVAQQQQFSNQMRQSFRNVGGHGRSFNNQQLFNIGDALRNMSVESDNGGKTASFQELGQLASDMGRMNMMQGVRNVQEFKDQFKKLLSSVKTVAKELGTSLQEANKIMASMKGSGIFSNQGSFATNIRNAVISGNLSTAEVSAMGSIGSQISRQVGGLGKDGATAGIKAINQLGSAVQAGIVSEEDIYNVTGMAGAQGRQAFASQQLQAEASFFKGNLGRRVVAAVAGKDGNIDQEALDRIMSGSVGTDDVMKMAYKNLAKVGRANFIRNEGRLRGKLMAGGGMLTMAQTARGWLKSRNINMDDMDDRSMLFFQKKFNLGRDQADNLIKMARSLESITAQQDTAQTQDSLLKDIQRQNSNTGLTAIKNKVKGIKNKINTALQQAGADFYKNAANNINSFINKLTGTYEADFDRNMVPKIMEVMKGGDYGQRAFDQNFSLSTGTSTLTAAEIANPMSAGGGGPGLFGLAGYKVLNESKLNKAGYSLSGATSTNDVNKLVRTAQLNQRAFQNYDKDILKNLVKDKDAQSRLNKSLTELGSQGKLSGRGNDFLNKLNDNIDALDIDPAYKDEFKKAMADNDTQRASQIAGTLTQGVKSFRGTMSTENLLGLSSGGKYATTTDRQIAEGKQLFNSVTTRSSTNLDKQAKLMEKGLSSAFRSGAAALTLGASELAPFNISGAIGDRIAGFTRYASADNFNQQVSDFKNISTYVDGFTSVATRSGMFGDGVDIPKMADYVNDFKQAGGVTGFSGKAAKQLIMGTLGPLDLLTGGNLSDGAENFIRRAGGLMTTADMQKGAAYLETDKGKAMLSGIFNSNKDVRSDTIESINEKLTDMYASGADKTDQAEIEALKNLKMTAEFQDIKGLTGKERNSAMAAFNKKYGEQGIARVRATTAKHVGDRQRALRQYAKQAGTMAENKLSSYAYSDVGKDEYREKLKKAGLHGILGMDDEGGLKGGSGVSTLKAKGDGRSLLDMEEQRLKLFEEAKYARDEDKQELLQKELDLSKDVDKKYGSMTTEQLLKLAEQGGPLGKKANRYASTAKRLKDSRGDSNDQAVIAGALGLNLKAKDFKGGNVKEAADKILEESGVLGLKGAGKDDIENVRKQLLKSLEAAKKGKNAEAAVALDKLQGNELIKKAREEKQNKSAEQNDPSYRALSAIKTAVEKSSTTLTSIHRAFSTLGKSDPKEGKSAVGGSSAPAGG